MKFLVVAIFTVFLSAFGFAGRVRAEQDCALGQRYVALAHERETASEFDDAMVFLQHAIDTCPSYDAYQSLGDLQAQSPQREDQAHAVDALVSAYQWAPNDQARALALLSYAKLLNQDGDPQNAYPIIKHAQALDPANPDIAGLVSQIRQRVDNPTKESISRGLWNSLYKPLNLAATNVNRGDVRAVGYSAGSGSGGGGPVGAPAAAAASTPALNERPAVAIKINFDTGSTLVDEQTRSNIAVLAQTLADPAHGDQHFIFVGHADARGVEANNVQLSRRRAEAIYQSVTMLQPSLRGRIEITGKGSAEPIDLGNSESAYRENRRLQVLLK